MCIAFNGASIGIASIGHVSEVVAIESCLLKKRAMKVQTPWNGSNSSDRGVYSM